jgi:hypothetical protein
MEALTIGVRIDNFKQRASSVTRRVKCDPEKPRTCRRCTGLSLNAARFLKFDQMAVRQLPSLPAQSRQICTNRHPSCSAPRFHRPSSDVTRIQKKPAADGVRQYKIFTRKAQRESVHPSQFARVPANGHARLPQAPVGAGDFDGVMLTLTLTSSLWAAMHRLALEKIGMF